MTIHNTTASVSMTRDECESAARVLEALAVAADGKAPELKSAGRALAWLLEGCTHLVLRENDDE